MPTIDVNETVHQQLTAVADRREQTIEELLIDYIALGENLASATETGEAIEAAEEFMVREPYRENDC